MTSVGLMVPWITSLCTFGIPAIMSMRAVPGQCPMVVWSSEAAKTVSTQIYSFLSVITWRCLTMMLVHSCLFVLLTLHLYCSFWANKWWWWWWCSSHVGTSIKLHRHPSAIVTVKRCKRSWEVDFANRLHKWVIIVHLIFIYRYTTCMTNL